MIKQIDSLFLQKAVLLTDTKYDPMAILKKNNNLGSSNVSTSTFSLFDFQGLYYALKENSILIGAIVVVGLLVLMMFVHDPKEASEAKKDVEHKLFIIFLICSAVWIFDVLKKVCQSFML